MRSTGPIGCAFALLALAACRQDQEPLALAGEQQQASVSRVNTAFPTVTVYKNATCGCCGKWVEHMQQHGFALIVHDVDNMNPIKERVGLPYAMGSCHTAEVGGYFIEGHVPAAEVLRLLKEKPQAKGLSVPGMPVGSPGMEQGDLQQPYDVYLVKEDGSSTVFAHYPREP
jgi:hypothetical protein